MKSLSRKFLSLFLVIGLLSFQTVLGSIYVEITGGQVGGLPIAVVPFVQGGVPQSEQHPDLTDIASVIRSDLQGCGQFKAVPPASLTQFPGMASDVQYSYWQGLKVENIVIGQIQKTAGRYAVNFELLDIVKNKTGAAPPLLSVHFDDVLANQFRELGHHIADMVFEKLIGIKGIFSTRIAYVLVEEGSKNDTYTLEVADQDGHNPKPLYKSNFPIMSPAWSPDGQKIAFVSFEKNRASVNIVEVSTGKVERITSYPGINGAPAWSPDGRSIALVLSKDGSPKIYTIDLSAKHLQQITTGNTIDTEPFFSPDGQSIVFTSNRGGKAQIYRVILASGKVDRITFKGVYNARPSITPDGKRLVMMHRGEEGGPFGIAVQTLATGGVQVLTHASLDESPSLAPNGMMVLYGSQDGVLGAVSLDGRVKLRLPARTGNVQEPAWSPFVSS